MTARLSDILLKLVLIALVFTCAALLLRDAMAMGLRVPLDPNEGWNAYHALSAAAGQALYPHDLMVNNYPPLSFYIVGALGDHMGDNIIAGRLVSLLSFLSIGMGLAALLRQMGARVLDGIFAGLLFSVALLIASDYVGMNDPQLLGHALQIEALLLLLRARPAIAMAAALMVAGLFVKHSLLALPLAAFAWSLWRDRGQGLRLAIWTIGFGLTGLLAIRLLLGVNLVAELASARVWRLSNLTAAVALYLSWAGPGLLLMAALGWRYRRDVWMRFCLIYAAIALALGLVFSAGDGVDANIFFDLTIAMALGAGLALMHLPARWRGALALGYCLLPALFLARNFPDGNFAFTENFQKQAPLDIGFLEVNRGPALCENLALCYWAGKEASVDVFNVSEQFQTGRRSDAALVGDLNSRVFRAVQLDSLSQFALGPNVRAALMAHYRVHHIDDNGAFLVPKDR